MFVETVLLGGQKSKIEGKISEKVSRSYRMWYDRLVLAVRLAMPPEDPYTVIHSENLVGLFTCIFVRSSERMSLKDSAITTIKRGMKGHYGNKARPNFGYLRSYLNLCYSGSYRCALYSRRYLILLFKLSPSSWPKTHQGEEPRSCSHIRRKKCISACFTRCIGNRICWWR